MLATIRVRSLSRRAFDGNFWLIKEMTSAFLLHG
ncbi:hypothetical protein Arad_8107 [Rhizobium rhizogenes K84]|uniref:Uncharacterized protein n=1 Tax=Rhizobium rhizogenes (strain K84 / ATCC BAA-868) TaxID=311403 RepID=B9JHR4_RHIR8|nr:hypothetical protein Arad_8107 [Rhizobium rhizogenes K84]